MKLTKIFKTDIFPITILMVSMIISSLSVHAQQTKDKGEFIPWENDYYKEIQESLDGVPPKPVDKQLFKMNQNDVQIPQDLSEFKTVWCNDPISQGRTGTCWCFSTSSFYESEVYRLTGKEVKLSELYIVYWEYVEKAREYIKTRGESFFGEGSETNAVQRMMEKYGAAPLAAYLGKNPKNKFHDHESMYSEMNTYLKSLERDNAWNEEVALNTIKSILNHHIGQPPSSFMVQGKSYTPQSYLSDFLKINPKDYVDFMSLMEQPYYTKSLYNVPDNWWKSEDYYNVPLSDFMGSLKKALDKGYSISIGGDVSESGYRSDMDVAMVPSFDIPSEYIDENARQFRFSNGSTTDDHAIHLIGYSEKNGTTWFLIKDSGSGSRNGKHKGYYFYHEDYVKLKMMTFTVHRDAVSDLLDKMAKK